MTENQAILQFDCFELDLNAFQLKCAGNVVHTEPKVFDLIKYLAQTAGQIVSRDDMIDHVWDGRIVSDTTVASCVKAARKALGDTGHEQKFIRTIRSRGFQFVADVKRNVPASSLVNATPKQKDKRPSIIVLPFAVSKGSIDHPVLAEALSHDIIQALSRLRWIRVIARGTAFRFRDSDDMPALLASGLDIRYCLTGSIEVESTQLRITFELVDLDDQSEVWVDHLSGRLDDIHELRDRVVQQVSTCVEVQIPFHEAKKAQLVAPENLDAWSAYHLGLVNMFRFKEENMHTAVSLFERAVVMEPTFARAHAGLSFAQFQLAFNQYPGVDIEASTKMSVQAAEKGLELDAFDPFCNFTHGRTFWLTGDLESSIGWFERSTEISPSFAQGHYATAFASVLTQQPEKTLDSAQIAHSLSPLDPFLWAFCCVRAFAYLALEDYPSAQNWANRAAMQPGALVVIDLTAVVANHLSGDTVQAEKWALRAKRRKPDVTITFYFQAIRFQDAKLREKMRTVLLHYDFMD